MFDQKFQNLDLKATKQLLADIANEIEPIVLPEDKTTVQVATLPFYDEFKLYALSDASLPAPNTRYMLYKPGDVSLMNWTNEPIYSVNERAPIKLDRKTAIPYAKFFFHFVRGQLGRFIGVEKPEEVVWLANANDKEKEEVAARLIPVTYKGVGRDNLFTLTATVVFKNALFTTDIKIAPYEMDVFDAELNAPEHFTIGQMKLTNEELLMEELQRSHLIRRRENSAKHRPAAPHRADRIKNPAHGLRHRHICRHRRRAYRAAMVRANETPQRQRRTRPNPFIMPAPDARDDDKTAVSPSLPNGQDAPALPKPRVPAAPASLAGGLEQIKVLDPSFDEKTFLQGARAAFTMIVEDFAKGDMGRIARLLGPRCPASFPGRHRCAQEAGQTHG